MIPVAWRDSVQIYTQQLKIINDCNLPACQQVSGQIYNLVIKIVKQILGMTLVLRQVPICARYKIEPKVCRSNNLACGYMALVDEHRKCQVGKATVKYHQCCFSHAKLQVFPRHHSSCCNTNLLVAHWQQQELFWQSTQVVHACSFAASIDVCNYQIHSK